MFQLKFISIMIQAITWTNDAANSLTYITISIEKSWILFATQMQMY